QYRSGFAPLRNLRVQRRGRESRAQPQVHPPAILRERHGRGRLLRLEPYLPRIALLENYRGGPEHLHAGLCTPRQQSRQGIPHRGSPGAAPGTEYPDARGLFLRGARALSRGGSAEILELAACPSASWLTDTIFLPANLLDLRILLDSA